MTCSLWHAFAKGNNSNIRSNQRLPHGSRHPLETTPKSSCVQLWRLAASRMCNDYKKEQSPEWVTRVRRGWDRWSGASSSLSRRPYYRFHGPVSSTERTSLHARRPYQTNPLINLQKSVRFFSRREAEVCWTLTTPNWLVVKKYFIIFFLKKHVTSCVARNLYCVPDLTAKFYVYARRD